MNIIHSFSGSKIEDAKLEEVADKAFEAIMSGLPEEARTYEVALYVVEKIKNKINASKIYYRW